MPFELRVDAIALEVDQERRGRAGEAVWDRDKARVFPPQRHDAHGHREIGEGRAVRGVHAEVALGVGHEGRVRPAGAPRR